MVKRSSCKTDHRITVILYSGNSDSTVLFFSITGGGLQRIVRPSEETEQVST